MFSHPSICSSLRLRFTELAKLQCLQSSTSINYRNYSQLRSRVNCMITDSHSKVVHPFRTNGIASQLKPNSLGAANIISRGYLGNGSSRPVYAFSKRFFSQAPSLTNKLENELSIGEKDDPPENKRTKLDESKLLGFSPSGLKVFLKGGPNGSYVQLGENRKRGSPKRMDLGYIKQDTVTLEVALELLRYPLTLGIDPMDGKPVVVTNSNIDGVIVKKAGKLAIAPKDKKPCEITMEYALELLSLDYMTTPKIKPSFPKKHLPKHQLDNGEKDNPIKNKITKLHEPIFLGFSPSGQKVFLKGGPNGSYVQLGENRKRGSPKRMDLGYIKKDSVTLEVALELLRYPLSLGIDPMDGKPVMITNSNTDGVILIKEGKRGIALKGKKPGEITLEYALKVLSHGMRLCPMIMPSFLCRRYQRKASLRQRVGGQLVTKDDSLENKRTN